MKKVIILIQILTVVVLINLLFNDKLEGALEEDKFYYMNVTAYSRHSKCISKKYDDGYTATMTSIREGVCALNVDLIDGKWVVVSPLKLGQHIYIEDSGIFSVEDTGRFSESNSQQDIWTVDIYKEDYNQAVKFGKKTKKVWILEE